jgi:hypothetical protein
MQVVDMPVDHIEVAQPPQDFLDQYKMRGELILAVRVEPDCLGTATDVPGRGDRITAGEQRNVVARGDEGFRQV